MTGLGILILIVVFFWLFWPALSRWLKRKAMERAEDYMRSSMGLPPREKKKRWGKRHGFGSETEETSNYRRRNPYERDQSSKGPIIPKEYAEDVEFTEIIDYSEKENLREPEGREHYHESQISDAEFTEIKKDSSK